MLKLQGFTIVELLIVIVVIGILAAIVIVAYNGITVRADRTAATNELKVWSRLFETYRAQYGDLPALANGNYCLGTGFPTGYCRYAIGPNASSHAESTGDTIMTELSKVAAPPKNSRKITASNYVGPFLTVSSTTFSLSTFMPGTDTGVCGNLGLTHAWINSGSTVVQCRFDISK